MQMVRGENGRRRHQTLPHQTLHRRDLVENNPNNIDRILVSCGREPHDPDYRNRRFSP